MIQDIAPRHFYNQFRSPAHTPEDIIFVFNGPWILAGEAADEKTDGSREEASGGTKTAGGGESFIGKDAASSGTAAGKTLAFPRRQEFDRNFPTVYLFAIDEQNFYLADTSHLRQGILPPAGYTYVKMHALRMAQPKDLRMAAVTAHHLSIWYRNNRFCGRCGQPTHASASERALVCRSCGNIIYPKIAPAVIVGVKNGDSILMTRYRGREYGGHALIAGFTEIGETAEETVAREVMEETGVHVKNIRYYKDQPWGFSGDLLFGFFCDLDGSPDITMDRNELSVAEWVRREDITETDDDLSLTREMILYFRDHPDC